jgi:signal transduction histidine kinase
MGAVVSSRSEAFPRPALGDALIGLVLAGAAAVELAADPPNELLPALLGVAAASLPLAWRASAPVAVAVIAFAGLVLASALGDSQDLPVIAWLGVGAGLYSLGEHGSSRQALLGGVCAGAGYAVVGLIDDDVGSAAFGGLIACAAVAVGRAVHVMGFESERLEARIDVLRDEQDRRAREAVHAERARIARELHDVIGHSISVMGVQAGAVRRVLPPGLAEERETLLSVERTGRDAVTEMQRLLDLIRERNGAPSAALPDLAQVPRLVDDMRGAGLSIELETDGPLDDLPPGRALAAYRIVQEALTNALKHDPGSPVRVLIARAPTAVSIEVLQRGQAPASAADDGRPGHGLVGMRERVALYGGTLTARPGPDGGFEVRAEIPLQGGVD